MTESSFEFPLSFPDMHIYMIYAVEIISKSILYVKAKNFQRLVLLAIYNNRVIVLPIINNLLEIYI